MDQNAQLEHNQRQRLNAEAESRLAAEAERFRSIIQVLAPEDARLANVVGHSDTAGARAILADRLKEFSPTLKSCALGHVRDGVAFNAVLDGIYSDAERAVRAYRGPLRSVTARDPNGQGITRFFGDPLSCWSPFSGATQRGRINRHPGPRS